MKEKLEQLGFKIAISESTDRYNNRRPYVKYYKSNKVALVAQEFEGDSKRFSYYIVFEPSFATLDDIFDEYKNEDYIFMDLEDITLEEADKFASNFYVYDGYRHSCIETGSVLVGFFKADYFLDTKEFVHLYYTSRNEDGNTVEYSLTDNYGYLLTYSVNEIFEEIKDDLKGLGIEECEKKDLLFVIKRLKEIGCKR